MEIYKCSIKLQSYFSDYDAKSLIELTCQPEKARRIRFFKISKGIGFRYQHDVKFNLRKSEFHQIKFTVPICKDDKELKTEIVNFKIYGSKTTGHKMRVPLSCNGKL